MTAPHDQAGRPRVRPARDLHDQAYRAAVARMRAAGSGRERALIVSNLAVTLGVTKQAVYAGLERHGWSSGRAARSDRGTSVVGLPQLEHVVELVAKARNKYGQTNLYLKEAVALAKEQGLLPQDLSVQQVSKLLSAHGLSLPHLRAPRATTTLVTAYPNHLWQFDISVAIQWYFRDENGKRLDLYSDAGARFNLNKLGNIKALQKSIHRFLMVDHYSGAYFARYYYSAGENSVDVVDFFSRAMTAKASTGPGVCAIPMHGVPEILYMDQGPANKSGEVLNLLGKTGLDVQVLHHMPGVANATGAVESRHNVWQHEFEGRLALELAHDLEELNAWAEAVCAKNNATRPHSRHGRPPSELWMTIPADKLREPPSREAFFQLASSRLEYRKLNNQLKISVGGDEYAIAGVNVFPGQRVAFRFNAFSEVGIRVFDEHGVELAVTPIRKDPVSGFPLNGPRAVVGDPEHGYNARPATPAQKISKEVVTGVREVRVPGQFEAATMHAASLAYLEKRGAMHEPKAPVKEALAFSEIEARNEVRRRLARKLSPEEGDWWGERAAHGLTHTQFSALWAEFTEAAMTATGTTGGTR